jgi:hypothetical protein
VSQLGVRRAREESEDLTRHGRSDEHASSGDRFHRASDLIAAGTFNPDPPIGLVLTS